MKANFLIQATIAEETLEPWVWMNDKIITTNKYIIIENSKEGKSIKTFKRTIDKNFMNTYNSNETKKIKLDSETNYLILSEYYRFKLGISKNTLVSLEVYEASWWQIVFKHHWRHPNPAVQFANRLSIISIILAIFSFLLTIYSIILTIIVANSQ